MKFIKHHKSAIYSIMSLGLRLLTGPLSILLITTKLSPFEQGIYYTFIAIASIQWVFELGISTAIVQHLSSNRIGGRLINAYVTFAFIFLSLSSFLLFFALLWYAFYLFQSLETNLWLFPWAIYALFISINVLNNIILIYEESRGNPETAYRTKLYSGIAYAVSLIGCLLLDLGLYSLGIAQLSIFFSVICVNYKNYIFVAESYKRSSRKTIAVVCIKLYKFQFKLSMVWILGYFYWNIYTIYIFKFVSVEVAGKYGAANAVLSAISIAMASWLNTKRSIIGRYISDKKYQLAENIYKQCLVIGLLGYSAVSILFLMFIYSGWLGFDNRFLNIDILIIMVLMRFAILWQECILIYLRMYKDEPLYILTVINYFLTVPIVFSVHIIGVDFVWMFIISTLVQIFAIPIYVKGKDSFVIKQSEGA
ncbi:hypothetical protein RUK64_003407 [Vibrio cholerae]|nr:hypothetical protein [Vibrio cholerae]ELJ8695518.1 hypothetical protein [Vibrio cholerae]